MSDPVPSPQPSPAPPDWRTPLGEMGQAPALSIYKGEDLVSVPRTLVKSHLEVQKLVGADHIAKPQESWTDAQWDDFHQKIGRPETPDKYAPSEVKLPEGVWVDPALKQHMLTSAHAAGLTNRQFDRLWKDFLGKQSEAFVAEQQADIAKRDAWVAEQRQKLGTTFDATVDLSNRALSAAGAAEGSELLTKIRELVFSDGTPFLRHPVFVEVFGALGQAMSEGSLLPGGKQTTYGRTKDQLDQEISKFSVEHGAKMVGEDATAKELQKQYDALLTERMRLQGIVPT